MGAKNKKEEVMNFVLVNFKNRVAVECRFNCQFRHAKCLNYLQFICLRVKITNVL